jgi:Zn-dependent protease
MQKNWQIGSLFGIPLYIDSSWLFILILVTILNGLELNDQNLSGGVQWLGFGLGLIMALLLFISVLLHELGHSLVAQNQGITVN